MNNTIVTHQSLDQDAITAIWLIKRFLPGWDKADIEFVPAGSTLDGKPPDENENIIHVDTGLGRFDHHQTDDYTSASKRVFEYLVENKYIPEKVVEPLERLVNFINEIDHFSEAYFPDATQDRYDFTLYQMIEGLKATLHQEVKIIEITFILLNSVLYTLKNKVKAEKELKKGLVFKTKWGRAIAMETGNEEAMKLALKSGYILVIRKDPEKGHARIKTLPEKKYDLTPVYEKIKSLDNKGVWFLHVSKNMLLNSSSKNPHFIPTTLSLPQLIEIIKGV